MYAKEEADDMMEREFSGVIVWDQKWSISGFLRACRWDKGFGLVLCAYRDHSGTCPNEPSNTPSLLFIQ